MASAESLYEEGARVRKYIDGDWIKYPGDGRKYPASEQIFKELRAIELSRTWKERHAKGVPVKMDYDKYLKCLHETDIMNGIRRGWDNRDKSVFAQCTHYNPELGIEVVHATFCNFRYKPEWLEKKKRIVCSDEPPPTQHRGGVTEW